MYTDGQAHRDTADRSSAARSRERGREPADERTHMRTCSEVGSRRTRNSCERARETPRIERSLNVSVLCKYLLPAHGHTCGVCVHGCISSCPYRYSASGISAAPAGRYSFREHWCPWKHCEPVRSPDLLPERRRQLEQACTPLREHGIRQSGATALAKRLTVSRALSSPETRLTSRRDRSCK